MHHIYHTEAFVLRTSQSGEDSKIITLYTNELGLIHAKAQGIRKISSKLRFTLQNFSYAKVDLVRGKEIWRITTASPIESNMDILCFPEREIIVAHVTSLVARLVAGEERNDEIFAALKNMFEILRSTISFDETYCAKIELFYVAKILMSLGYMSRSVHAHISQENHVIPEHFDDSTYRKKLVSEINEALSLSQL
ncbi:MAG: DNA repair protein RecO [bacterium]